MKTLKRDEARREEGTEIDVGYYTDTAHYRKDHFTIITIATGSVWEAKFKWRNEDNFDWKRIKSRSFRTGERVFRLRNDMTRNRPRVLKVTAKGKSRFFLFQTNHLTEIAFPEAAKVKAKILAHLTDAKIMSTVSRIENKEAAIRQAKRELLNLHDELHAWQRRRDARFLEMASNS